MREIDGLAGELGGPAGVVAEHLGAADDVDSARHAERLAVVERLESARARRAFASISIGELPQQLGALAAASFAATAPLSNAARAAFDREIDVGLVALGDLRDHAGRRPG